MKRRLVISKLIAEYFNNDVTDYSFFNEALLVEQKIVINDVLSEEIHLRNKIYEILGGYDDKILVLKGEAVQSLYPKNKIRVFNDIDLCVKNIETFYRILKPLERIGFKLFPIANLKYDYKTGSYHFIARLTYNANIDYGIEIHCGGFVASDWYIIPWDTLSKNSQTIKIKNNSTITIPEPCTSTLLFFVEMSTRKDFLVRDYFDAYVLFNSINPRSHRLLNLLTEYNLIRVMKKFYCSCLEYDLYFSKEISYFIKNTSNKVKRRYFLRPAINYFLRSLFDAIQKSRFKFLLKLFDSYSCVIILLRLGMILHLYHISDNENRFSFIKLGYYLAMNTTNGTFIVGVNLSLSQQDKKMVSNLTMED